MKNNTIISLHFGRIHFSPVFVWLFVLLLLSVQCFSITPIVGLFSGIKGLVIYLFWLLGGCIILKRNHPYLLLKWHCLSPAVLILLGVVLSFIPAYIYYGQDIFTSLIACRVGLVYFTLPALLLIRPRLKDIKLALFVFSALFFILMICDSYLHLPLIAKDEKAIMREESLLARGEKDVNFLGGIQFVAMSFFFYLEDCLCKLSKKNILITLFLFLTILLFQNRSTLFSCVIITAFCLLSLPNTRRNIRLKLIVVATAIVVFAASAGLWIGLLKETGEQVSNTDYNRNLAYAYFLFEAPNGLLNYILGCGFLSSKATTLMQDMMEIGIFNSDVGFIGMWNQFGLIPILVMLYFCILQFRKGTRMIPKFNSLFILLCSLTTAYFFELSKIVWYCIFVYICSLYEISSKHTGRR